MALQAWARPKLSALLPLPEDGLDQIISYLDSLSDDEATKHLRELLGETPESLQFIASFSGYRAGLTASLPSQNGASGAEMADAKAQKGDRQSQPAPAQMGEPASSSFKLDIQQPPAYGTRLNDSSYTYEHTNQVIEAALWRAQDEQHMQQMLQDLQYYYNIYNPEVEPEHEYETRDWTVCNCRCCEYQWKKDNRRFKMEKWALAVAYPGEKCYSNLKRDRIGIFTHNPYRNHVGSPFMGREWNGMYIHPKPLPHAYYIQATITRNNQLNQQAQKHVDACEPEHDIWDDDLITTMSNSLADPSDQAAQGGSEKGKKSRLSSFRKSLGFKSAEEKALITRQKALQEGTALRNEILAEELSRWPDKEWRQIVAAYQVKVGITIKIAELRQGSPLEYLHLLRAGYFEPIPSSWATSNSNPLKFAIEGMEGWPGITPAWRGYEDTAEERLYWVLNHREGKWGTRMKPDLISELKMANERMSKAVEPPPLYYDAGDVCHKEHTSKGYSKQVMPAPFRPCDRPQLPTDDTMVLLDVSGSMDFDPCRPIYDFYLIRGYEKTNQPRNNHVAKAIIWRFVDALSNHDHRFNSYDLVTFSNRAAYHGRVNHQNLDDVWNAIHFGSGTRVMTGWQQVKDLHFQKYPGLATHHPYFGWQAGPDMPMLRLLLLLDGEATDMDEFELDLLSCSWAHITIFLIGAEGCPHHHRHANELQRISDVNPHVSFVDAQGNCPERFVTHELLKRHLGYDVSMQEFQEMERLPTYEEEVGESSKT